MSEFTNTELYRSIYNQIKENWDLCEEDRDDNEDDIYLCIEEFKLYYGNHENSIFYYDFNTEFNVFDVLKSQRFIIEKHDDYGMDMDIEMMKDMTKLDVLQKQLVYWVMEDFCDELMHKPQITTDEFIYLYSK